MSLMSCLEAVFSKVGGMTATFSKVGGELLCSMFRRRGTCGFERVDTGFTATAVKKSGMTATFGIVCSVGLDEYILWASDGIVFNVYGEKIYLTRKWQED